MLRLRSMVFRNGVLSYRQLSISERLNHSDLSYRQLSISERLKHSDLSYRQLSISDRLKIGFAIA